MDSVTVRASGPISRNIEVPGDKSLSHRALLLSALADGPARIRGLQTGGDVLSSRRAIEALGVVTHDDGDVVVVEGRGIGGLVEPDGAIDCGNSGTTIRLLSGIVSGQAFLSVLTGDASLCRRPMARVLDPLRKMGALALGRAEGTLPPLVFRGGGLQGCTWRSPVASAQVKSAVLLAGLHARGATRVDEPARSRDHTERMLTAMGATLAIDGAGVTIEGRPTLRPVDLSVPGDPSSAAFWVAAALMVPGSKVTVGGVSLNPTRIGFFQILERMGAPLELAPTGDVCGEPVGDVRVEYGPLTAVEIGADEVPTAIDEFPVLGALAAVARGETEVSGAGELRLKESDRIDLLARELRKAGVPVETAPDGFRITGGRPLSPARFHSHGDHRLAMAMGVLSLAIPGGGVIEGADAASVSYPGFWEELDRA